MTHCSIPDSMLISFWDVLYDKIKQLDDVDQYVVFNDSNEARGRFIANFKELDFTIATEYMKPHIDGLDRHKQAAILIIAAINAEPVIYKDKGDVPKGKVFVWQTVPVACGLSYMLDQLNRLLDKKGSTGARLEKYYFPKPLSCTTDYLVVLGRNLLYASKKNAHWKLNPIDLANTLFLLEFIATEHYDIDTECLKEYTSHQD